MTFLDIATPLAKMGIPITPVRPGTKRAFLPDFPTTATTNLERLVEWNALYPDHNAACVARAEQGGVWFFEVDSPDVFPRIQKDTGHDPYTELRTYKVRSRPGRGHLYFRHDALSIALGNISQTYVVGQDWSVRTNREYVVAPGSIHPDTGKPYEAVNSLPIEVAPGWLVEWMLTQKIQKHSAPQGAQGVAEPRNENGLVPHGSIHGYMLTQAGKLRAMGLDADEIYPALSALVAKNCQPPIDESKVEQMAKSICNFPAGTPSTGYTIKSEPNVPYEPPEDTPEFESIDYPVFPRFVMTGTSIYEGFVKPYCEKNSRIDYFMWMPTAAMMMNYLGTRINIPFKNWKPSFYMVLIGYKGRGHKSSSIKDGMKFLEYASVLQVYSKEIKNAEGKSVVWEAGSPEGLGTDMQRINCKNAILFYDELQSLVNKASIDTSGLSGALLKLYESANFSNTIKSKKDAFSVAPDSYCATLITATTDKKFTELWSKLAGEDTGLDDRFTFVLQPEELPEEKLAEVVNYIEAGVATRKIIDRAVEQKEFHFFDQTPFKEALKLYGTRCEMRAEKWALYFAVDLGLKEIDEDCVERGIALARYEHEVKRYLMTFEARNDEAAIQQGVVRLLKKNKGVMELRDIERTMSATRYGTTLWNKAFYGLVNSGYIALTGKGVKGDPKMVRLLRDMRFSNDD